MAEFAGKDLKIWRQKQMMTASELAERMSCDVTTIYRYESEKIKASPDVMYDICKSLGDVSRWCDWMRTEFPTSYGVVHPETPDMDISCASMMLYVIVLDVLDMEKVVLRSIASGRIDDPCVQNEFRHKLEELNGVSQLILNQIARKEGDSKCRHRGFS